MAEEKKDKKKVKRPTAQKRVIQSEKRNLINRNFKSQVRTAIRALENDLPKKDAAQNKKNLSAVYSLMDKGVKKGVYSANKANRTKARLAAYTAANA